MLNKMHLLIFFIPIIQTFEHVQFQINLINLVIKLNQKVHHI